MPTRIRIDLAGYHHIINRGVDRRFNHWGVKLCKVKSISTKNLI